MRRHTCHIAGKRSFSLVRDDDFHIARLADNAHFGPNIEASDLIDQPPDPDAPDLFIIGKRQMQWDGQSALDEIR